MATVGIKGRAKMQFVVRASHGRRIVGAPNSPVQAWVEWMSLWGTSFSHVQEHGHSDFSRMMPSWGRFRRRWTMADTRLWWSLASEQRSTFLSRIWWRGTLVALAWCLMLRLLRITPAVRPTTKVLWEIWHRTLDEYNIKSFTWADNLLCCYLQLAWWRRLLWKTATRKTSSVVSVSDKVRYCM